MTMFDKDISKGTRILQAIGGFLVMAIFTAVIVYTATGWSNANEDRRQLQSQLIKEVNKGDVLQDEYNKLYKEFTDATGKKPDAASPQEVQSIPGATGPIGEQGLKGETGIPGISGPIGTPGATGEPGVSGVNGANGNDGKNGIDGPPGPQGIQGEPGAIGAPGANGTNGANGRGLQSVTCDGDGLTSVWTITYTDGTTSQTAGPCRLSLLR